MRFTPQLRTFDWLVARPIAHRGLHDQNKGILENTAGAFEAAIKGNYAIECDVQLTADGEAILERAVLGGGHGCAAVSGRAILE